MKKTFILETDDDDSEKSILMHELGPDAIFAIWDFDQWIRSQIKYAGDDVHTEYIQALKDVRQELSNQLYEKGINVDHLIS